MESLSSSESQHQHPIPEKTAQLVRSSLRKNYLPLILAVILAPYGANVMAATPEKSNFSHRGESLSLLDGKENKDEKYNKEHEALIKGFITLVNHGGKIVRQELEGSVDYKIYDKSGHLVAVIAPILDLDEKHQMAVKVDYELRLYDENGVQKKSFTLEHNLPSLQKLIDRTDFLNF